jgi:hypothetical protein
LKPTAVTHGFVMWVERATASQIRTASSIAVQIFEELEDPVFNSPADIRVVFSAL